MVWQNGLQFDANGNLLISTGALGASTSSIQLAKTRNAFAKVRAATGRARVLLIGDSTTVGAGAGTSGNTNLVGAQAKNRTNALAARLASLGIPTSANSFMCDSWVGHASVSLPNYDSRISLGTGWSIASGTTGLGGDLLTCTSTGTLAFTPTGQIDRIQLYYPTNNGLGSFSVNVDGGSSLGTFNQNGTSSVTSQTFSVTKGSHTINVVGVSGTTYVIGIVTWDSTTPAVDLITCGMWGSVASNWTAGGSSWNPPQMFATLGQDLAVVQLIINDSNAGLSNLSTYTSNMSTIISGLKAQGDVIVESGIPSNTTQATDGTLAQFAAALSGLASNVNSPFVDIRARWVNYSTANALGWMFDDKHPNAVGYADVAQAEAVFLNGI